MAMAAAGVGKSIFKFPGDLFFSLVRRRIIWLEVLRNGAEMVCLRDVMRQYKLG